MNFRERLRQFEDAELDLLESIIGTDLPGEEVVFDVLNQAREWLKRKVSDGALHNPP